MKVSHMFIDAAGSANVIQQGLIALGYHHITLVNFVVGLSTGTSSLVPMDAEVSLV